MRRGYINTVKKIVEMARKREIIVWWMDLVSKCVIKDFLACGIAGYTSDFDVIDSMLGYNRYYNGCLGFKIYGDLNNDSNAYKIMALGGGSTTGPTVGNTFYVG